MGSKHQYTQRRFRAGTFFAGLLSLFLAAAVAVAFGFVGVNAVLDSIENPSVEAGLAAGAVMTEPMLTVSIGLILAVPIVLYGVVDMVTGFQPDYVFKRSVFYEIAFSVLAAGLSYVLFRAAASRTEIAKLLFVGCAIASAVVAGLRALSLLWFFIRCIAGKAHTKPPYVPIEPAAPDAPKTEKQDARASKKKQATAQPADVGRKDSRDAFKDVRPLKTADELDDL